MNDLHQGIVILLQSAIAGQGHPLPDGFDMERACAMAGAHHMSTLIYEGALRCGMSKDHPAMRRLFPIYCKAMLTSERQMLELQRVFDTFEQHAIDYMPLKGSMMKALYPRPELRMMGDADILIRQEQYEKIEPLVRALGFQGGECNSNHYVWSKGCLCLELHTALIAQKYPALHAYFGSGWDFAHRTGGTRYEMSVEDTFVYLFSHFSKHFGNSGVGCRHVTDLWVYLRSHPEMDEAYVLERLKQLDTQRFYSNIRKLLGVWFEGEASDDVTDAMTAYIMSNGSWGNEANAVMAAGSREKAVHDGKLGPRASMLLKWIYPGAEVLRKEYPVLEKAPVLLPVMACVRGVSKLCSPAVRRRKQREMTILGRENMTKRQQMLDYFGLKDG